MRTLGKITNSSAHRIHMPVVFSPHPALGRNWARVLSLFSSSLSNMICSSLLTTFHHLVHISSSQSPLFAFLVGQARFGRAATSIIVVQPSFELRSISSPWQRPSPNMWSHWLKAQVERLYIQMVAPVALGLLSFPSSPYARSSICRILL